MDFPDYTVTREFRHDWNEIERNLIMLLTPVGFTVSASKPGLIELTGPGMNSSRQSPIVGCSKIRVTSDSRVVTLDAELGGARWLGNFVRIFPVVLTGGILAILSVVFWFVLPNASQVVPILILVLFLDVGVWLFLGPLIARRLVDKSRQAADGLMVNLVQLVSKSSELR
jgi:hypothetical protein